MRVRIIGAIVNLREAANRREILGRRPQDLFQLLARLVEPAELEQRPAQSHACGQVGGMPLEAGLTRGDRLFELSGAPVLFGERGEGDRRRVHVDPAFEFFDAGTVGH